MVPSVAIDTGELSGTLRDEVAHYRGIPYANATRFAAPTEAPRWEGVRDATRDGPICPQPRSRLEPIMGPNEPHAQAEDCLTLAVATPSVRGRRPVMVWFHGGAYLYGAGSFDWYRPDALVREGGVVVVTVNYRVGLFGYLRTEGVSEGNLGLLDQLAALRWVKRNIGAFGGDPENVTVFGESAGGHSIAAMLCTAAARGLFRRAIVQSAQLGLGFMTKARAATVAKSIAVALGGESPARAGVGQLLAAQQAMTVQMSRPLGMNSAPPFAPIAGVTPLEDRLDHDITASTVLSDIELLIGSTRDEMRAFFGTNPTMIRLRNLPFLGARAVDGLGAAITDKVFGAPLRKLADTQARHGAAVYTYRFEWAPPSSAFGACHTIDLPFVFGDQTAWQHAPMLGGRPWSEIDVLGRTVRGAWTRFVHTGDPNSGGSDTWPRHRPGDGIGRTFV